MREHSVRRPVSKTKWHDSKPEICLPLSLSKSLLLFQGNFEKAKKYFERAPANDWQSQYQLGVIHFDGLGLKQPDYVSHYSSDCGSQHEYAIHALSRIAMLPS